MPQIGPAEIIVILLVGMLVFGPSRLPEIGKQVGRAMREVKKFQAVVKNEIDAVANLGEPDPITPNLPTEPAPSTSLAAAHTPPAPAVRTVAPSVVEPGVDAVAAPSRFRVPVAATRAQD